MFSIKSNLNRRSTRYNIYQPQRYAIYLVGESTCRIKRKLNLSVGCYRDSLHDSLCDSLCDSLWSWRHDRKCQMIIRLHASIVFECNPMEAPFFEKSIWRSIPIDSRSDGESSDGFWGESTLKPKEFDPKNTFLWSLQNSNHKLILPLLSLRQMVRSNRLRLAALLAHNQMVFPTGR